MNQYNRKINSLQSDIPPEFYSLRDIGPMQPFSENVISYLNILSKEISKDPLTRHFPDVATFAFFCRKANILQLKKQHYRDDQLRLGRGMAFHVAPSNVPVNFAYSLVTGLLSGNTNIVKIPSKAFEQIEIISKSIFKIAEYQNCSNISERVLLVSYDRGDENVTEKLSSICDVRIIWGGDETIKSIRKHQIPPRSFDITFADRYSFCVINADKLINENKINSLAQGFYNDTYLFDQHACTSPHLIIWIGEKDNIVGAQTLFWGSLYKIVKTKYNVQAVSAIDKLTTFYSHTISNPNLKIEATQDNLLFRIKLDDLSKDIDRYSCHSGYFYEYQAIYLNEIDDIVNRRYQTLSYYGFVKKELKDFIESKRPDGIDRIVPIGKTMDFSLNWDGYNLINILSREIEIS